MKINGYLMQSKPLSIYPTESNVKVDIGVIDEEERLRLMTYKSEQFL